MAKRKLTRKKSKLAVPGSVPHQDFAHGHLAPFLDENEGFLCGIASRLIQREINQRLLARGFSFGQLPVLGQLWAADGQVQRELCRRIVVEEATLTNTLNRMAADGLIERRQDQFDNKRRQRIFLTERGRALRDELIPEALATNRAALEGFSDRQKSQLRQLLRRIIDNLANYQQLAVDYRSKAAVSA